MQIQNLVGITVVVPSLNQGEFIDETLQSLLEQNYPLLEVLVMDGGSTDDTLERLRCYGDKITWISEKDHGQADAIGKGFSRATYDWLTWLNSDDVQSNRALWKISDVISGEPSADVILGRGYYMDADGGNRRPYPTIKAGDGIDILRELFEKGYVAQPSVYFRKSAYQRAGGIDDTLRFCMDYDLWVRLAQSGCRFTSCVDEISGNRWYSTTKTAGQIYQLLAEVAAVQVRHFGRVSPYFVQAISDNLYDLFHAKHFGNKHHLCYRILYFKTVWMWLNARVPLYCIRGLFWETIAKSGPVVGDKLVLRDYWTGARKLIASRLGTR